MFSLLFMLLTLYRVAKLAYPADCLSVCKAQSLCLSNPRCRNSELRCGRLCGAPCSVLGSRLGSDTIALRTSDVCVLQHRCRSRTARAFKTASEKKQPSDRQEPKSSVDIQYMLI